MDEWRVAQQPFESKSAAQWKLRRGVPRFDAGAAEFDL